MLSDKIAVSMSLFLSYPVSLRIGSLRLIRQYGNNNYVKLIFYLLEGDDLSSKIKDLLDMLFREFKDRVTMSSRVVWPGYIINTVKIRLHSTLTESEHLEYEVWNVLEIHKRDLEKTHGLSGFPAVKIGEKIFTGVNVVDIVSDLNALIMGNIYTTAEEISYHLANIARSLVEEKTGRKIEWKGDVIIDVLKATIDDKIRSLDEMLRQKKISEGQYKKMIQVYRELLRKE